MVTYTLILSAAIFLLVIKYPFELIDALNKDMLAQSQTLTTTILL